MTKHAPKDSSDQSAEHVQSNNASTPTTAPTSDDTILGLPRYMWTHDPLPLGNLTPSLGTAYPTAATPAIAPPSAAALPAATPPTTRALDNSYPAMTEGTTGYPSDLLHRHETKGNSLKITLEHSSKPFDPLPRHPEFSSFYPMTGHPMDNASHPMTGEPSNDASHPMTENPSETTTSSKRFPTVSITFDEFPDPETLPNAFKALKQFTAALWNDADSPPDEHVEEDESDPMTKAVLDKVIESNCIESSAIIDNPEALRAFLDGAFTADGVPPVFSLEVQRERVSEHGSISLLALSHFPLKSAVLVDIRTLGKTAFTTKGASGRSLKWILESEECQKVIFDSHVASQALFFEFDIRLTGVKDIQLMQSAALVPTPPHLGSLPKAVASCTWVTAKLRKEWLAVDKEMEHLLDPSKEGNSGAIDQRPLPIGVRRYCANRLRFSLALFTAYMLTLSDSRYEKVRIATSECLEDAQEPGLCPEAPVLRSAPDWDAFDEDE